MEKGLDDSMHKPTQRVLLILEALAGHREGMTLTQLAAYVGSSKGTLFPILGTLQETGYLSRDPGTNEYRFSHAAYIFAEQLRNQTSLLGYANARMEEVVGHCSEICQLGVLSGREVVYIAKVDSREAIQIVSYVGARMPAHKTALGKALLCQCSREELVSILQPDYIAGQHIDIDRLYAECEEVRRGGVARDIGEVNEHLYCIALPVLYNGKVDSAVSVSLPSFRADERKLALVEEALRAATSRIAEFQREQRQSFSSVR